MTLSRMFVEALQKEAFGDNFESPTLLDRWREARPGIRRPLAGMLAGGLAGGAAGALIDKKHRLRGAAIGATGGALAGVGAGALYNKLKPLAKTRWSAMGQALDNTGVDPVFHDGKEVPMYGSGEFGIDPTRLKVKDDRNRTSRVGKVKLHRGDGELRETGRHVLAIFEGTERDRAGRISPVHVHGPRDGRSSEESLQAARDYAVKHLGRPSSSKAKTSGVRELIDSVKSVPKAVNDAYWKANVKAGLLEHVLTQKHPKVMDLIKARALNPEGFAGLGFKR
jgi:hypothetical protein